MLQISARYSATPPLVHMAKLIGSAKKKRGGGGVNLIAILRHYNLMKITSDMITYIWTWAETLLRHDRCTSVHSDPSLLLVTKMDSINVMSFKFMEEVQQHCIAGQ